MNTVLQLTGGGGDKTEARERSKDLFASLEKANKPTLQELGRLINPNFFDDHFFKSPKPTIVKKLWRYLYDQQGAHEKLREIDDKVWVNTMHGFCISRKEVVQWLNNVDPSKRVKLTDMGWGYVKKYFDKMWYHSPESEDEYEAQEFDTPADARSVFDDSWAACQVDMWETVMKHQGSYIIVTTVSEDGSDQDDDDQDDDDQDDDDQDDPDGNQDDDDQDDPDGNNGGTGSADNYATDHNDTTGDKNDKSDKDAKTKQFD